MVRRAEKDDTFLLLFSVLVDTNYKIQKYKYKVQAEKDIVVSAQARICQHAAVGQGEGEREEGGGGEAWGGGGGGEGGEGGGGREGGERGERGEVDGGGEGE